MQKSYISLFSICSLFFSHTYVWEPKFCLLLHPKLQKTLSYKVRPARGSSISHSSLSTPVLFLCLQEVSVATQALSSPVVLMCVIKVQEFMRQTRCMSQEGRKAHERILLSVGHGGSSCLASHPAPDRFALATGALSDGHVQRPWSPCGLHSHSRLNEPWESLLWSMFATVPLGPSANIKSPGSDLFFSRLSLKVTNVDNCNVAWPQGSFVGLPGPTNTPFMWPCC